MEMKRFFGGKGKKTILCRCSIRYVWYHTLSSPSFVDPFLRMFVCSFLPESVRGSGHGKNYKRPLKCWRESDSGKRMLKAMMESGRNYVALLLLVMGGVDTLWICHWNLVSWGNDIVAGFEKSCIRWISFTAPTMINAIIPTHPNQPNKQHNSQRCECHTRIETITIWCANHQDNTSHHSTVLACLRLLPVPWVRSYLPFLKARRVASWDTEHALRRKGCYR